MTNKDWDEIYDLFEKVSGKIGSIKESGLISCKYMMGLVAVIFVLSLIFRDPTCLCVEPELK